MIVCWVRVILVWKLFPIIYMSLVERPVLPSKTGKRTIFINQQRWFLMVSHLLIGFRIHNIGNFIGKFTFWLILPLLRLKFSTKYQDIPNFIGLHLWATIGCIFMVKRWEIEHFWFLFICKAVFCQFSCLILCGWNLQLGPTWKLSKTFLQEKT